MAWHLILAQSRGGKKWCGLHNSIVDRNIIATVGIVCKRGRAV